LGDAFLVFLYFVFMPLTLAFAFLVSALSLELEDWVTVRSPLLVTTSSVFGGSDAIGVVARITGFGIDGGVITEPSKISSFDFI
jgi:hypothetical protein